MTTRKLYSKEFLITHVDQRPFHQLDLYWSYVQ
jgi:hypothetical protein